MNDESKTPDPEPAEFSCSFCGKTSKEVEKLVAGPSVCICNECVVLCSEILAEERSKDRPKRLRILHELVGALDEQLVGHDEQKRIIAANLLRQARMGRGSPHDGATSILLVGPRGTGKSFLIELASTLAGLPVVVVDASRFNLYATSTWEDVFDELVRTAGTIERAETGVICIEHVDRIFGLEGGEVTRAIQRALLDVTSGMMIRVSPPETHRQASLHGRSQLDTKRIKLVFTVNLDGAPCAERDEQGRPTCAPRYGNPLRIQARDLVERGMLPELVDRMGLLCSFEPLSSKALEAVLRRVDGPIKRYVDQLEATGLKVTFTDDAIARIAAVAANGDAGVRGLWQVLEAVVSAIYCTVDASVDDLVVQGDFVEKCLLSS